MHGALARFLLYSSCPSPFSDRVQSVVRLHEAMLFAVSRFR
jgi:hypothetical protein